MLPESPGVLFLFEGEFVIFGGGLEGASFGGDVEEEMVVGEFRHC